MNYVISTYNGEYQAIYVLQYPEDDNEHNPKFTHVTGCQSGFSFWLGADAENINIFYD